MNNTSPPRNGLASKLLAAILLMAGVFQPLMAQNATELPITISGTDNGRVFEGMGAVSSSGNTRLLLDYPEPYRSDILDFLFKPKFGTSFQHLKVEIGGGENAGCGSEPSHAIVPEELSNPKPRGWEFWLMHEARKRNPKIILECLPWSIPAWCEGAFTKNSADWFVSFLDCAKKTYGLDLDYVAAAWNERGSDPNWVVNILRPALDKAGYGNVKLQGPDFDQEYWKIFDQFANDPKYSKTIEAVSYHIYHMVPATEAAKASGKPLWMSEDTGSGSLDQLKSWVKLYVRDRITKYLTWVPIAACYEYHTCFWDVGFVKAHEPWSGYYNVPEGVWYEAHVTQFTEPGWQMLDPGCMLFDPANPKSDAGCLTLKDPNSGNWSLIAATDQPVTLKVKLGPGLAREAIHVWKTSGKEWFVQQPDLAEKDGTFTIQLAGKSAYSITTTTGQHKGQPPHPIPATARFPAPYNEDFESYEVGAMPKYFMDQKGTFEVAEDGRGGKCLKQILPREGTIWQSCMKPNTIFGDNTWESYELSADVRIIGGDVEIGGHHDELDKMGYRFGVNKSGQWSLYYHRNVLATGTVAGFDGDAWHKLKVRFYRSEISGFIDGARVVCQANAIDTLSGRCFLATTYDPNLFDNIHVNLLDPPLPRDKMRVSASSCYGSGQEPENVLDGRMNTIWCSGAATESPFSQSLTIDLGDVIDVNMLSYLPRQDGNQNGIITAYNIYVSMDGKEFRQVATGSWAKSISRKLAEFPPTKARYVKLEATSSVGGWAAAAEINLYPAH